MLRRLLIIVMAPILTACGGGNTSSGGGSSNPSVANMSGIMIDPMSSVPVINGSSTQGTLYIHNYSNQAISGLSYSLSNPTFSSRVTSLLFSAGISLASQLEDNSGFVLLNPERCQSIAANSSCAVNFSTPSLSFGNQGNSLVRITYKDSQGKSVPISQVVNYSYVDSHSIGGVNFTSNLDVTGTSGSTRYVVGYLYAGNNGGSLYRGVSLVPSSPVARISGGFINSQEVAANQVIAVEFAVAIQDTTSDNVSIVPTWQQLDNQVVSGQGVPFNLQLRPNTSIANYVFGLIPLLTAPTTSNTTINVVNNGSANGTTGMTATSEGGDSGDLTIDATNCTSTILLANAQNSCQITFSVTGYNPGNTEVVYKDGNGVELSRQEVIWLNNSAVPAVRIVPNPSNIIFGKHESSDLLSFSLQNIGSAPLESVIYPISITGPASWVDESSNCQSILGARQSCVITGHLYGDDDGVGNLTLKAVGSYNGIDYNYISRQLVYEVHARPHLYITPVQVVSVQVLANNESMVSTTYLVTNHGNDPALFRSISLESMTNLHKPVISGNGTCNLNTTLLENESCNVIITYGPESSNISINESGSTHVVIDYHGGTPDTEYSVVSESYNYSLVGNDTYVIESISVTSLTGEGSSLNPYYGKAFMDPMYINIEYINPSVNYPLTNFNLNVNNLPYGIVVASSTCPLGSEVQSIAIGESCGLQLQLDRDILATSSQGGSVVLDFITPTASWTTPLGFYSQSGVNLAINYLQPTVSFSLSNNNGAFESTILNATLSNESAGVSPFVVSISSVNGWLESSPLNLSNNCTVNQSNYSASCSLTTGANESAQIKYFMPTYLQAESKTTVPLLFNSTGYGYLSPKYMFINFIQD